MDESVAGHVAKRATSWGRWIPVAFYAANVILWFVTGLVFGASHLLGLVLFTIPALVLYLWRTRWSRISR